MTESVSIVKIEPSHVKGKRLCVTLNNGKKYNFGLDGGHTYLDHHDTHLRTNYRKRHYASLREKPLIENLTPSASLLSFYLLWGPHTDLSSNVNYLNRLWQKKGITG